jgi:two-component sensor histidine kinase
VQNAIEHAFPDEREGVVSVQAQRRRGELTVTIVDNGIGLPDDFMSDRSDRLGLQIVRTLASAELSGTVEFRRHDDNGGTDAVLVMPLGRRARVGG